MATRDYGQISLKLMDEGLGLSISRPTGIRPVRAEILRREKMRDAKALGLTMPFSLFFHADAVIE